MTEFKFYNEYYGKQYLQLHDHHTIWEIDKPFDEEEYCDYVRILCIEMENRYKDLTVYTLGRSGRHVCVDDTPINRRRYRHLVACAEKLEQELIDYFNNREDV